MLSKLLLIIATIFLSVSVYAQNIYFKFKDGSSATYTVDEIQKFTFTGNEMVLLKKDGTTVSWNASSIENYRYDVTTPVSELELINNAEVKIYPNPFKGAVHIRYELPTAEQVAIEIIDMQGRSIRIWPKEKKNAGTHEIIWQANDVKGNNVQAGTYICLITTTKGSVSKMIVME
jgi:hypothetical protein